MMRGRRCWGVAVRRPSGDIARVSYPLPPAAARSRFWRIPVVRGVVALYESMSLGIKALGVSANISLEGLSEAQAADVEVIHPVAPVLLQPLTPAPAKAVPADAGGVDGGRPKSGAPEPPPAFGWRQLAVTVVVALAMAVGLFIVVPLVVVKQFEETFANPFLFNLVEGLIRIAIFILYLVVISLIPDLRRTFEYHGAEHKVIHAYEACGRPDAEFAETFSPRHPRCGTGFLLLVMVLAVFLFAFVGKPSVPWLVVSRLIGIPLIIGIAYEIGIKWAGRSDGLAARMLRWPGMQLQRLTTREPSMDQLLVAAAALDEVLAMDETEVPAGREALALS